MGPEAVRPGTALVFPFYRVTSGDGVYRRARRGGLMLLLPASCKQYYEPGLVRRSACIRGPLPIDH